MYLPNLENNVNILIPRTYPNEWFNVIQINMIDHVYVVSKVEDTWIISCLIVTYARTNVEIRMLIYLECLLFMEFTGINL